MSPAAGRWNWPATASAPTPWPPGPTESQAQTGAGLPETVVQQIKREEAARIPLGRRGEPEEVATWILRLADPATTWLTGQVPAIDGGLNLT
ncbi:SDR family oxidoreductase [Nonomuraea spiralis]|uniref:SDR family oxidoreductase n=1 Tax=Nonomuraea spiralis TaxID=46182 RepID=UPI001E522183|nr:SDR family oxidoreductase [Nonomuraea spiralis]